MSETVIEIKDLSKIYKLGWAPKIKFKDGLMQVIKNRGNLNI